MNTVGLIFNAIFVAISGVAFLLPQPSRKLKFSKRPIWWFARRIGEFLVMWHVGFISVIEIAFHVNAIHREHQSDMNTAYGLAIGLGLFFSIIMLVMRKYAWTCVITVFASSIISQYVSVGEILHLSIFIIVLVGLFAIFLLILRSHFVRLMVAIQYSLGIAISVTFAVLFVWLGVRGWLRDSVVELIEIFAVVIALTIVKVIYTITYAYCMRKHLKPSITLDSSSSSHSENEKPNKDKYEKIKLTTSL